MGYLDKAGLSRAFTKLKTLIDNKADVGHTHTKNQVGLGNVDNTADSTKSVKYAESSNYANLSGKANGIVVCDTRNENPAPSSTAFDKQQLTADFKMNDKINSPTGFSGTYCGVLSLAPWSETSGGHGYQLAFGYASAGHPRLALRGSDLSATAWNSWYKIYTSDDKPTLSELGAAAASHTHTKSQITDFAHTHDDRYYTESEVDSKLNGKANSSHTHSKSQITDFPSSMPASDVYAWAKQSSKPSYSASEVGAVPTSRKVNGKALSSDISLSASDVGAAPASHSHNIIVNMGNHNEIASGTTPNSPTAGMASSSAGLYLTRSYNDTTAPTSYGNILNVVGVGTGQLFMGWSGNDSTSEHLYYRSHRDTSTGGWGQWNTIIDSSNIGSQSVSHANTADSVAWTNVSGRPSSMPASDVYSWAKQSSKPSYSASEVGAVPTSRKVNGKALSSDISLSAGDVGAAPSSHTHKYAGSSSAGGDANWANGANYSNYTFSNNGVSTSGNGSEYKATISDFSLATGKSIVIIPNVTSKTTTPTLNVSGTGAKNIRMRLSSSTSSTIPLINSNFLTQYKPVKVTYDGTYWVIDDFIQPDANHLYGTLISRGSSAPSSGTAGFIYIQTT